MNIAKFQSKNLKGNRNVVDTINKAKDRVLSWIENIHWQTLLILYSVLAPVNITYGVSAEEKWTSIINFFVPWVQRIGGAFAFVGGIMFAIGWKQNDAEGKTNGINMMIAGCIIIAVGASANLFLF